MLSTAKIGTASWRYYADQVGRGACEYFLGVGEAPGRWYGRGIERLGLTADDRVSERELESLFGRALHPTSREQLGRTWRVDGVTGYDLCFSAPKSVSALWALGDDETVAQVRRAHAAAVRAGLDYLDRHAAFSRLGRDGHAQVASGGMAAAVFDHRTSRAGDPQLHSHALVVNKVRCADGAWRTVDGHEIYAHKKSAGAVYQAALRGELTHRLGVAWTAVSKDGQAEIAGVPTELAKRWSTRTAQVTAEAGPVIAGYEQALGRALTSAERTAVLKVAVLKTRPGKDPVDILALSERWEAEAAAHGWDTGRLTAAVRDAAVAARDVPRLVRAAGERSTDERLVEAVAAAGGRRACFSLSDLAVEVAARLPIGDGLTADMTRELVERWTDRAAALAVRLSDERDGGPQRASDARYASVETLAAELRILARADAGRAVGYGRVHPTIARRLSAAAGLDPTQTAAVRQLTGGGDFLSVLVAPAGTGKTTTVGAAAAVWRHAGYRVLALGPAARAAQELGAATGLPAETVAKFFHDQHATTRTSGGRWWRLTGGTVLIVDEASMLPTHQLDALSGQAASAGAKLVLVGDPGQLGSIDTAGGMLPALAARLGAARLGQVHRFRQSWEHAASLALREGDPAALDTYRQAGRIHAHGDGPSAVDAAVDRWAEAIAAGQSVLLLARTRADVDALNAAARARAVEAGRVTGPVLTDAGGLQWRQGDVLRATRNTRTIPVGDDGFVRNGDRYTVTAAAPDGGLHVTHQPSGAHVVLPADYLSEHAAYGWAATVDAAQGATVDVGVLLARPGLDREHLYVGLTRGRHANHVHLAPADTREPHHLPPASGAGTTGTLLAEALSRSGRQTAAHTRLPEPLPPPGQVDPYRYEPPRPTALAVPAGPEPAYLTRARAQLTDLHQAVDWLQAEVDGHRERHADLTAQARATRPWQRNRRAELEALAAGAARQASYTQGQLENCQTDIPFATERVTRYEQAARTAQERSRHDAGRFRRSLPLLSPPTQPIARTQQRRVSADAAQIDTVPDLDRSDGRGHDFGR